jgi:hypothetical protein
MALDTFVFTISLPIDADSLALVREVSGYMAQYLGLPEEDARQAREMLDCLVADRLKQLPADAGPMRVSFGRPHAASTVIVDVLSAALPGDPRDADESAVAPAGEDGHSRIRMTWRVHDESSGDATE